MLLCPTGMVSVLSGTVDDGYGGMLGWIWVACAVTTIGLVHRDPGRAEGAAVLGGDGRHRPALPGDPHRLRHRPRRPRRPRLSRAARSRRRVAHSCHCAGEARRLACRHAAAIWSGAISFGLVNIPVKLYNAGPARASASTRSTPAPAPASSRSRCRRPTARRCPTSEIVKGYELAAGQYVLVTDDELAAARSRRPRARSTSRSSSTSTRSTRSSTTPPTTSRPTRPRPSRTRCWPGPWRRRARSASPAS